MAKEWILNSATNRFQLNFKRNVGPTSYHIRLCQPKRVQDWECYYFKSVYPREHLISLGKKLYMKITEVLSAEIAEITEKDCIDYIYNLVINRTFDGYQTEIETIYGQLEGMLGIKIHPAPDEWDRTYNVDFYIKIDDRYIGLQIKPAGEVSYIPQIFKEHALQEQTHKQFTERFSGKVFYVISINDGRKKRIHNLDVVDEIRKEMARLQEL